MVGESYIFTPQSVSKVEVNKVGWSAIAYGNGRYIVVGSQGCVISSTDGVTWSAPKYLELSYCVWHDIIYANGRFVAVGGHALGAKEAYIASSNDGINWTTMTIGTSGWSAITYGNGKYVATGFKGQISTSLNGIDWTTPTSVGPDWYMNVTYGNSKFIAVGKDGYIANSKDGITWVEKRIYFDSVLCGTYGQGKFVVLSNVYSAMSSDGMTWTKDRNRSEIYETSMVYGGGMYVSVGLKGKVTKSTDGVNWTTPEVVKDNFGNELEIQLERVRCVP